ncbi:hypothetical protein FA13DRAFT_1787234 [Coprinellus micaceus]|uniref:Uncharacterized protein n=1 Tax=Coprinellus micaceus TaxID=71717 RepID=A0A4Y7TRX1_COPMI|nr:hypothetical protein FA13DRAFT_1787234 [Coprinellus micaceus]
MVTRTTASSTRHPLPPWQPYLVHPSTPVLLSFVIGCLPPPPHRLVLKGVLQSRCYGLDDRMLHPQLVSKGFEWASGIIITTTRYLKKDAYLLLEAELNRASDTAFSTLAQYPKATLLGSLITHAKQCLERLEAYGLTHVDILVTVGDFQHSCLDIHGIVSYMVVYYPRSYPLSADKNVTWPCDDTIMGGLTQSREEAQFLHSIGIPVWWIRPQWSFNPMDTIVLAGSQCFTLFASEDAVMTEYTQFGTEDRVFHKIYRGLPGTQLQMMTQRLGCRVFDLVEPSRIAWQNLDKKLTKKADPTRPIQPVHLFCLPGFKEYSTAEGGSSLPIATPSSTSNISGSSTSSTSTASSVPTTPPQQLTTPMPAPSMSSSPQFPSLPINSRVHRNFGPDPMPSDTDKRPPEIEVWTGGVSNLTVCKRPEIQDTLFLTYYTPDPNFILCAEEENEATYVATWIVTRNAHMYNVANGIVTEKITKQQWRQFLKSILKHIAPASKASLELGDDSDAHDQEHASSFQPNVSSSSSSTTHSIPPIMSSSHPTHVSHRSPAPSPALPLPSGLAGLPPRPPKRTRRQGPSYQKRHKKNGYLESLPVRSGTLERILYFEQVMLLGSAEDLKKAVTPSITAEVIWELREDTWHLELMALDQALAPKHWPPADEDLVGSSEARHTRLQCESAIRRVLPARNGEELGEIFVTEIPNIDTGLVSYHWSNRHGYLLALQELMLSWHKCPEWIVNADTARVELPSRKLERLLVKYYCESFFDTFGRAPIVPCRLPHHARIRDVPTRSFGSLACIPPAAITLEVH